MFGPNKLFHEQNSAHSPVPCRFHVPMLFVRWGRLRTVKVFHLTSNRENVSTLLSRPCFTQWHSVTASPLKRGLSAIFKSKKISSMLTTILEMTSVLHMESFSLLILSRQILFDDSNILSDVNHTSVKYRFTFRLSLFHLIESRPNNTTQHTRKASVTTSKRFPAWVTGSVCLEIMRHAPGKGKTVATYFYLFGFSVSPCILLNLLVPTGRFIYSN